MGLLEREIASLRLSPHEPAEISHPDLAGLFVYPDEYSLAHSAALLMGRLIHNSYDTVCFATGNTMEYPYDRLVRLYRMGFVDTSHVTVTHLDEWVGIDRENRRSFAHEMRDLWNDLQIPEDHRHYIMGDLKEQIAIPELNGYLATHRRILTITGIGEDGHFAFVIPNDPSRRIAHKVSLNEHITQRELKRGNSVIDEAYTMGLDQITDTDVLLLIATGAHKAHAVAQMLQGPVDTFKNPSQALRERGNGIVLLDREAASLVL